MEDHGHQRTHSEKIRIEAAEKIHRIPSPAKTPYQFLRCGKILRRMQCRIDDIHAPHRAFPGCARRSIAPQPSTENLVNTRIRIYVSTSAAFREYRFAGKKSTRIPSVDHANGSANQNTLPAPYSESKPTTP
ncbi:MAG TPA: hypothetical protein PKJ16_19370, partial [Spirochaetota bacterium]|nr:hypothetical protein [Spirochaetota bacterium]